MSRAICVLLTFAVTGSPVFATAQDRAASNDAVRIDEVRDLQVSDSDLRARRAGPNPTDEQVELMDELTEVSDTTEVRNRLEAAQRMAPIDLLYGVSDPA